MFIPIDSKTSQTSKGSISAFVVCITMSLLVLTGFVIDGGRVIARYAELSDIAENASRIGSQQVVGIRAGDLRLNESGARQRINEFLGGQRFETRVDVHDGGTVVEIRDIVPMRVLSIIGIRQRQIVVTRTSFVVSG